MNIKKGSGTTKYGPGIDIQLNGDEVARAILDYVKTQGVEITGAGTITVNGQRVSNGNIYVDPSASITMSGRGTDNYTTSLKESCPEW